MKTYKPRTQGFPFLTLAYLQEHGESKNEEIREAIRLNDWCENPNSNPLGYADRSSYQ